MSKDKAAQRRRQRRRLYDKQKGLCFWCKKPMLWLVIYPGDGVHPLNLCTIDHVYSKLSPLRQTNNIKVAACWGCNHQRAIQQDPLRRMTTEEVRELNASVV